MIRKIKKEDAQSIQEICDISLGYTVSTELVENQITKLSADKKHHVIYVYEDEIYECLYSDCGLNILGLAVLPEFQGRSIGKKLMNHLEMDSRQKLIKFIRLNSGEARTEAHKFYKNIGYVCDKTQKRFIKIFE